MIPENRVFATKTCVIKVIIAPPSSPIILQTRGVEEQKYETYYCYDECFCDEDNKEAAGLVDELVIFGSGPRIPQCTLPHRRSWQ